jgi:Flp pilus assembly protein TadG
MALLTNLLNRLRKFRPAREGNIAVIFSIALIPVVGAIGIAVDWSMANKVRASMQKALDAAVLVGVSQPSTLQLSTATAFFNGDFTGPPGTTATASFIQNSNGSLSGTANSSVEATFLGVFGISSIPVQATSTAIAKTSGTNVCILLVDTLDTQTLLVNSGAQITAPSCEIDVLTTQSPAAMFNASLNVERICIKGSTIIKNGGANPPAVTNCPAISDPFAGKLPTVSVGSCDFNNQVYDSSTIPPGGLNPGVYCGSTNFNGSGTLKLNPGLYVINNGAMIFNSGWTVTGTGVTFYLANSSSTITFNGNVNATLSAPTSGTYANILMFEPTGLSTTNLPINGSSGDSFTGLFYLPSRKVTINSVSNMTTNNVTMVFSTLTLDATNWTIAAGSPPMVNTAGGTTTAYLSQ